MYSNRARLATAQSGWTNSKKSQRGEYEDLNIAAGNGCKHGVIGRGYRPRPGQFNGHSSGQPERCFRGWLFLQVGHVIFSLEPYQNVDGCSLPPSGTANNQLVDSTDNVLSHEVFEGISDPYGDAWWVHDFVLVTYQNEIGDLCARAGFFKQFNNFYWLYGNVKLNDHPYTIQPEYSNQFHGCAYGPAFGPDE
jgi:hypothetical protein